MVCNFVEFLHLAVTEDPHFSCEDRPASLRLLNPIEVSNWQRGSGGPTMADLRQQALARGQHLAVEVNEGAGDRSVSFVRQ